PHSSQWRRSGNSPLRPVGTPCNRYLRDKLAGSVRTDRCGKSSCLQPAEARKARYGPHLHLLGPIPFTNCCRDCELSRRKVLQSELGPSIWRQLLMLPSSSGLGRRPLTAETGVRFPLGVPSIPLEFHYNFQ